MSPDRIAEQALLDLSRLQREALVRSCWDRMTLRHLHLLDSLPADEALAIVAAARRDEEQTLEMAA